MRYRSDYQETHDIDRFFRYHGRVYHAASNGGKLPESVDSENNRKIQELLEDYDGLCTVTMAEGVSRMYGKDADLSSFREYASKGFISLDRTDNDDEQEAKMESWKLKYHIVASPTDGECFDDKKLLELLPELEDGEIVIDEL